ncbi:MAG: SagB/ThcOx family dehydrogenase [Desulfobacterium sp.]|nr:SagB/ThcOx family dehydrogenase [Desulfobacterium sp.]
MDDKDRDFYRYFLKDTIRKKINFALTDQNQKVPVPPVQKEVPSDAATIQLPGPENFTESASPPGVWNKIPGMDLSLAIKRRKSSRAYGRDPLSLEELAYLLWCTQGVRGKPTQGHAYRTVPSAGCRHALETYLTVLNVEDLKPGIYRYLPLTHGLLFESSEEDLSLRIVEACFGQPYPGKAAVTFIWAAVPYRMEWRYGLAAHKVILLDAGHVCQNLYLACEAIDAGTCAIAAYNQEELDELLGLDGENEFAIYLAPVGKINKKKESV